ncbi:MAG: type II toxin-antitoxin system Phd/YefM family antitoxin [Candidatus Pacebacteria bacterium]|jgi:PHD/YefM family antitoxin component YafN of YafNO toxin-antitoxin module|nr:type II toxin-antitoxin system Phd/YefM family antitoxin [Candidatus Paceibacterota bacterium]
MSTKSSTMAITKARVNLGAVVERVRTNNELVTLEKGGIAVATIINTEHLEDLQDAFDLMIAREENRSEPLTNWTEIRRQHA